MKFSWFHLMPYRFLPEDFKQRYHSVWVDVPSKLYDPRLGHLLYNEYLDQLEFADSLGYDGIGVNEHHQNAYGMMPSPNLMAAALARRTRHANLLVLGNSIALYNPPIRVAEEFAMLDVLSGGRLIAGFPVGSPMDSNYCYGQIPATLREKYQEALDLIIRSWTEREVFAFNGKYTKLRYVNLWPRPLQQPHPPIWIPGGNSIETWDFCAENGYQYSFLSLLGYLTAKRIADRYWETLDRHGKELNPYSFGFGQLIGISETDAQAERDYGPHLDYFYNKCMHIYPGFADAPGYSTIASIKSNFASIAARQGASPLMPRPDLKWKNFVEDGYIIAGSPATVRQRLEEAIKMLRVGHLMVQFHCGSTPNELARKNTELFAREVMPHLRGMWSEYQDRWSPAPLPENERAIPALVESGAAKISNGAARAAK
jgi:alkanesulfonate monooxygenase SsuD/methylene tetrahydromethanopterin reductase-like flavin-dependent oxidoreductase (luciferase family)